MRKDVKLAFVVGGILISVLVVYVLVVPGGARKTASNQPVLFDTKSDKAEQAAVGKDEKSASADKTAHKDKSADQTAPAAKPNETKGAETTVAAAGPATRPNDPFASKGTEEDKWYVALQTGTVPLMSSAPPSPQTNLVSGKGETSESAKSTELKTTDLTKPIETSKPLDIAKTSEPAVGPADTTTVAPPHAAEPEKPVTLIDPPPAPAGTMRTHSVEKGETIAKIAEAAYGSQNYWPHIIRANPGIVAEKIRPGMVINLPPDSEVKGAAKDAGAKNADKTSGAKEAPDSTHADTIHPDTTAGAKFDPTKEYEVQSGDSLAKIAIKLYGTEQKWQAIYDLNKEAIGTDPAKVKVKSVLKLPEAPTQKAS